VWEEHRHAKRNTIQTLTKREKCLCKEKGKSAGRKPPKGGAGGWGGGCFGVLCKGWELAEKKPMKKGGGKRGVSLVPQGKRYQKQKEKQALDVFWNSVLVRR